MGILWTGILGYWFFGVGEGALIWWFFGVGGGDLGLGCENGWNYIWIEPAFLREQFGIECIFHLDCF
jgi:hypothetical protein